MSAAETSVRLSVGVDIGGTFTDLVAVDESTGAIFETKALTTPPHVAEGVWHCFAKLGLDPARMATIVHGSTIAINIAIEQTGARTALIVTRGTRDVYAIGRQNRPEAYDFAFTRPRPLVPRSRTLELSERLDARGATLSALDEDEVAAIARELADDGVESVAVCLLHAYANPDHEQRAGAVLRAALAGRFVSLSHEIVREYREYERTSTTVLNAYVGPTTSRYLGRMQARLADEGFDGRLLIMQSNGGVVAADVAKRTPVLTMESGPASGVMAAAELARRIGLGDAISFDMGGTTAKAALIRDGEPEIAHGYHIGGAVSGHPVVMPVVDIVEVGAGGGSIAWIDDVGGMRVGPRSASSDPGPACYGRGGSAPTVTDANVALGRIDPARFLGGEMTLDVEAARTAVATQIAAPLGLGEVEAALGILRIAVARMSLAVREVSVARGHDPRDLALVAMGGAGPLHAVEIARDLHVPRVVVPRLPAQFCALGMLLTDIRHDAVRTHLRRLDQVDTAELVAIFDELREAADAELADDGVARAERAFQLALDVRYVGQEFTVATPVDGAQLHAGDLAAVRATFESLHAQRYGHAAPTEPLEVVNLRLIALGRRARPALPSAADTEAPALDAVRDIFLTRPDAPVRCAVHWRYALAPGAEVVGPAVIEERASTTLLGEGDRATVLAGGELAIEVAPA